MSWRLRSPKTLVGRWPLNNNALDVSGYGNHGTWAGTEAYAAFLKNSRQAGSFDGVNSYVSLGADLASFGQSGSGYKTVQRLARSEGVHFIDLFPMFLERGSELYFSHDFHWTPAGHLLAAELVAKALVESR